MYLHAYPASYPYTPYPGAYLEPVTPRPAPSTAMANNQEPFSTPGIMAPSPAITEDRSGAVQHTFDRLSRAGVDYWISPADYNQLWSYLSSAAPDLASQVASPADYQSAYAQSQSPVTGGVSGAVQHTFDKLSRAGVDYWISPADYNQLWSYLSSVAPDLAGSVASPADYQSTYAQHLNAGGAPVAPAKAGGNVGILAALAAGAYFLFGRK